MHPWTPWRAPPISKPGKPLAATVANSNRLFATFRLHTAYDSTALYGTLRHSNGTLGAAVHSLEGHITSLRDLGPDLASAAVDLAENPEALGKRPSTAEGVTWHHSAETTRSSKLWDSWPGS